MKEFIAVTCLLLVAVNGGVIFSHHIIPSYYLHSGRYGYYPWIPLQYVVASSPNNFSARDYSDVIPHYAIDSDDVSSRSDYQSLEGRHRDDKDSNYGEATIPNYRMFHFVLKLVKSMRKHFLPLYATNPEDVSNIYVQYDAEKRRLND